MLESCNQDMDLYWIIWKGFYAQLSLWQFQLSRQRLPVLVSHFPIKPPCNIQLLGDKKKNLAGFSAATISRFRVGYNDQTQIFQSAPPSLRMRTCRLLAKKSTLAALVDSTRGDPTGKYWRSLREENIQKKIVNWHAITEIRKLANGMQFGIPNESSLCDRWKLRASVGQSKLAASLAFTPIQGMELSNPQALASHIGSGAKTTYFSEIGTFSKDE